MKKLLSGFLVGLMALSLSLPLTAKPVDRGQGTVETMKKIRKELVTLPFYGVFDNLAYKYDNGVVTLYGQVVRPTTKSSAEKVVSRVAGVEKVVNKIEVLPLSSFDDQIRVATYRAIYSQPGLDRLGFQAVPSVHIIVNRGHVTLEGVVPTKGDATRAYIAANGVPNVFSVTNNLRVENRS